MKRVLTALVLAPVVLAIVYFAPDFFPFFVLLLAAVAILAVRELLDLAASAGIHPYRRFAFVATAGLVFWIDIFAAGNSSRAMLAGIVVLMVAALLDCLSKPEQMAHAVQDIGATLLGILYPGLSVAIIGLLLRDFGPGWLIWLMLVVWAGDIAALYAGRAWGSRRLAPQVSPNKTYAGAVAGLVAALVVGMAFAVATDLNAAWPIAWRWFALGGLALAVSIAAQVGDLVESVFKRAAQVKDSGTLLPGHGGVLDRIDALLLAAPVLWLILYFVQIGSAA